MEGNYQYMCGRHGRVVQDQTTVLMLMLHQAPAATMHACLLCALPACCLLAEDLSITVRAGCLHQRS